MYVRGYLQGSENGRVVTIAYDGQHGTRFSKSNGKDDAFEYSFLILCRYLNLVKNKRIFFIANRTFTSCYNINILNRL